MSAVVRKQPSSQMCFICGVQNPIGLRLFFYEHADGSVSATFTPREEHQGFPGVVHGGVITAMLDESMARASMTQGREQWMMTAKLELRFLKPVPVGEALTVTGRVERLSRVGMSGRSELRLADGTLAAEAHGVFMSLPAEQQQALQARLPFWQVIPDEPPASAEP